MWLQARIYYPVGPAFHAILVSGLTVRIGFQHHFMWFHGQNQRLFAAVAGAVLVCLLAAWQAARLRRPSTEELERRRRERLASTGRIIDGSLIDARTLTNEETLSSTPEVLVYRYRLAGVTYECAQDVSNLAGLVKDCHVGNAVQVRYDPRNPGDSILVAESWSGLWLNKSVA